MSYTVDAIAPRVMSSKMSCERLIITDKKYCKYFLIFSDRISEKCGRIIARTIQLVQKAISYSRTSVCREQLKLTHKSSENCRSFLVWPF